MMSDTILVVDASAEARRWLIDSMPPSNDYTWLEAASLSEARAGLATRSPELLIIAARLGDDDGLALLREYAPALPIIVTTNHGSAEEISTVLEAGARDVLVKPFAPQRLVLAITRALRMAK